MLLSHQCDGILRGAMICRSHWIQTQILIIMTAILFLFGTIGTRSGKGTRIFLEIYNGHVERVMNETIHITKLIKRINCSGMYTSVAF